MKKVVKIVLVLIMLLGIAFSLSNFITLELKASPYKAAWVYANGVFECMGQGTDCDPFAFIPN